VVSKLTVDPGAPQANVNTLASNNVNIMSSSLLSFVIRKDSLTRRHGVFRCAVAPPRAFLFVSQGEVVGLESHQVTRDFPAIEFLRPRYNYWTDDLPHADPYPTA
jgi:hypothetical protein